MKFIDECQIEIIAGKGGNGIVSFRREARVARGGPDGGDGGLGGSIYFIGDPGQNTLMKLKYEHKIKGNDGENGRNKNQIGAGGEDIFVKVPLGTIVKNGNKFVADIVEESKNYLIAKGGKPGKGNAKFKSSSNNAPRISENGLPGEKFVASITLKVLADVGFVGKPSAGKSTLLSKISNAKPKIADYHFTTLSPQLGFVEIDDNSFVAADLPGLIKGASEGKGLGHNFLKHIERCRVLVHVVDFGSEEKDPIEDYKSIRSEIKNYSLQLETRPEIVVANKSDCDGFKERLKKFKKKFPKLMVIEISALMEKNIKQFKRKAFELFINSKEVEFDTKEDEVTIKLEDDVIVKKVFEGVFEVSGRKVESIYNRIPLNTYENLNRFNLKLKNVGAWKALEEKGVKKGDTVRIMNYEFNWEA